MSADQWTETIVAAFDTWSSADCGGGDNPSIDLLQLRDVACGKSEYNPSGPNANVVYFSDNGWSGGDIDSTLALTTVTSGSSGEILDADMAINSARHDFTVSAEDVRYDLQSIVTHEVGHFLGIAHSALPDAVMYRAYPQGTLRRTLTPDDVAAVCTLYPPAEARPCAPTPKGGLATTCTGSVAPGGCSVAPAAATGDRRDAGLLLTLAGLFAANAMIRQRRS